MAWETSNRKQRLPGNWIRIRATVLKRDGWICQLGFAGCQTEATDVDHIVAGDDHSTSNLQAACRSCHSKKSSSEGGRASAIRNRQRRQLRYRPTEPHPGRRKG